MANFTKEDLKSLYKPAVDSRGEDNGQVTIIGGSSLFHGAPLFALSVASKIVDMVFFGSPEKSVGEVAEKMKSKLLSFVWVPWEEVTDYIAKSDAILIGPGFLRFKSEKVPHGERHHTCDEACQVTKSITERLVGNYKNKKWVIDAGSLQTMDASFIPENAILTPNDREYQMLFGENEPREMARKYKCIIVRKNAVTTVYAPDTEAQVHGGNAGLTKGGTGDTQAGLTAALLAKNDPFLAACAGAYLTKAAADSLYGRVGTNYSADDLVDEIPRVMIKLI